MKSLFRIGLILALVSLATSSPAQDKVDFNNDIRPILSDTCYKCHGPDEADRKADLRLDTKPGLLGEDAPVVPGDLDASELFARITSDDPDVQMPPPDSGRVLSNSQKQLFKRWIEQGAEWQNHWSLEAPSKPVVPAIANKQWSQNPIDNFIAQKLASKKLSPSPTADRATLIRRVAFDLTGLPPKPKLVRTYVQSTESNWYELLVNELLQSPQYGEHMARFWLDAVRYGDTHGLHLDNYREMWPYRDWVVKAFNRNLSFRDFTIEQLAGDLLDDPTDDQLIASGFNRAHITTSEGGAIEEEVYVRNVVDRVSTTGTIFMGMTVGCAQCHDHKFDPITQKEFYQLFAFFNNMTDPPLDKNIKDPQPVLKVIDDEKRVELARLETAAAEAQQTVDDLLAKCEYVDPAAESTEEEIAKDESDSEPAEFVWVEDKTLPAGAAPQQKWEYVDEAKGPVNTGQHSRVQVSNGSLIQHLFTGAASPLRAQAGDRLFAYVYLDPDNPPEQLMLQYNDGSWEHRAYWGANKIDWGKEDSPGRFYAGKLPATGEWVRLEIDAADVGFADPTLINGIAFTQWGGRVYWDSSGIVSSIPQAGEMKSLRKWMEVMRQSKGVGLPEQIKKLAVKPADKLDESGKTKLRNYFLTHIHPESSALLSKPQAEAAAAKKRVDDLKQSAPTTLISRERDEVKPAFVLLRGEYDQKGDQVERLTPAALPGFADDLPKNRLGFARWLTDRQHPLTARVTVNKFWQQLFGTGIVKTSEDFGAQGEMPTHPELLDWLAVDFVESGWDVKRILKTMVMSNTYRQSSEIKPDVLAADPENRLLARGPRFRLDAEMLRDQALSVGGLLVSKVGGPGVRPPQPDGLWYAVGYSGSNTVRFKKDSGADKVHRRSLYTFWKRTAPAPQLNIFDAPSREECRVRRERTNTPLQALLLMNDPQYVEAARHFGQRILDAKLDSDRQRIDFLFENALARSAHDAETQIVLASLKKHRAEFATAADEASKLIAIGEQAAPDRYDAQELAAWTMVANLIMNMDEFVTKN